MAWKSCEPVKTWPDVLPASVFIVTFGGNSVA